MSIIWNIFKQVMHARIKSCIAQTEVLRLLFTALFTVPTIIFKVLAQTLLSILVHSCRIKSTNMHIPYK
jgi:hypothetical protein